MQLAKTLAIVACAGLLSAGVIGSARHAYAQGAGTVDPEAGGWSADTDGSQELNPEAKEPKPPIDVQGCWSGTVHDKEKGEGTLTLELEQDGTGLEPDTSTFRVYWNSQNYAYGPIIEGSVSSKGIKFKGTATSKCTIAASGTGNAEKIHGTYSFKKECAKAFKGGSFTIKPAAC
jgi:hypothetical protein